MLKTYSTHQGSLTSLLYAVVLISSFLFIAKPSSAAPSGKTDDRKSNAALVIPNSPLPSHPSSLAEVKVRLQTTLPSGPVETSITLYPTKNSAFTVSRGIAFFPAEWGVWGAEVLDGPLVNKRKEREENWFLRKVGAEDVANAGNKTGEPEVGKNALAEVGSEETEELDDDYKQAKDLVCHAAGFRRSRFELDFSLRDSWGAAIWEVECWVSRKSKLRRWWDSIWI